MFSEYVEEIPVKRRCGFPFSVGYRVELGCTVVRFFLSPPFLKRRGIVRVDPL